MVHILSIVRPLFLMFENIPVVGPIFDWLEGAIPLSRWIQSAVDFINNLSFAEQFLGAIIFGLIVLLGVFSLIKKLSKLIIVIAILVGLWLLYTNTQG